MRASTFSSEYRVVHDNTTLLPTYVWLTTTTEIVNIITRVTRGYPAYTNVHEFGDFMKKCVFFEVLFWSFVIQRRYLYGYCAVFIRIWWSFQRSIIALKCLQVTEWLKWLVLMYMSCWWKFQRRNLVASFVRVGWKFIKQTERSKNWGRTIIGSSMSDDFYTSYILRKRDYIAYHHHRHHNRQRTE